MSADDAKRASNVRRHVPFCHAEWPVHRDKRLCSRKKIELRLKGMRDLLEVLDREAWHVPNPSAFVTGIPHLDERYKDTLFRVVRAFATQKVHFLGLFKERLEGVGFDSSRLFCEAFPSLEPASGGSPRVEFVDQHRPIYLEHPARELASK